VLCEPGEEKFLQCGSITRVLMPEIVVWTAEARSGSVQLADHRKRI